MGALCLQVTITAVYLTREDAGVTRTSKADCSAFERQMRMR